jgi:hypothetical protein
VRFSGFGDQEIRLPEAEHCCPFKFSAWPCQAHQHQHGSISASIRSAAATSTRPPLCLCAAFCKPPRAPNPGPIAGPPVSDACPGLVLLAGHAKTPLLLQPGCLIHSGVRPAPVVGVRVCSAQPSIVNFHRSIVPSLGALCRCRHSLTGGGPARMIQSVPTSPVLPGIWRPGAFCAWKASTLRRWKSRLPRASRWFEGASNARLMESRQTEDEKKGISRACL